MRIISGIKLQNSICNFLNAVYNIEKDFPQYAVFYKAINEAFMIDVFYMAYAQVDQII
ncbi:hypothetical protein SDC9_191327 [bioreactor metagenome]|uniref:Uncharacterized protein n=1 Tax=bioreactor metagenome TaxID=1076179 RepID=A0A645HXP5_9ZZZZ